MPALFLESYRTRRLRHLRVGMLLVLCAVGVSTAGQPEPDAPDLAVYARIRDEGQRRSRVMAFAAELADGIGARLTGSPNLAKAIVWAQERLTGMGLSNVRAESWGEFGLGWEQRNVWARIVAPDVATISVQAAPWSPATSGMVTAEVIAVGGLPDERQRSSLSEADYVGASCCWDARQVFRRYGHSTSHSSRVSIRHSWTPLLASRPRRTPIPARWNEHSRDSHRANGSGSSSPPKARRAVLVPSGNRPSGGISGGTMIVDGNAAFSYFGYRKST